MLTWFAPLTAVSIAVLTVVAILAGPPLTASRPEALTHSLSTGGQEHVMLPA